MLDKILVSRYRLIETLGRGSFGSTYVAKDMHLPGNPQCVVKQLNPITKSNNFLELARRLFKTEAESLQKLGNHSQIPQLLAYFEEDEEFYLVQEFIRGHNLREELSIGTVWQEKSVIKFIRECLNILDFIHSHNVIHRDIKPDNLIRSQEDNKLVLVDFGAVKEVIVQNQAVSTTTIAIGTAGYMPSEQARGKPRFNSDIYAVGIIAIQALTGMEPIKFHEDDNGEIIWGDRGENITPELAKIINKMTRYHFTDRYLSAREVLQDLELLEVVEVETNLHKFEEQDDDDETIIIDETKGFKRNSTDIENTKIFREKEDSVKVGKRKLSTTKIDRSLQHKFPGNFKIKSILGITLGSIAAFGSLSLAGINIYQYQKQQRIARLLSLMQLNYQQKEYDICLDNAKVKGKELGVSAEKIQEFIGQCTLGSAKQEAENENYTQAIAIAKEISNNNPFAAEAKEKIAEWSQKIIDRIEQIYDREGDLPEINKIVNNLPDNTEVKRAATELVDIWKKEIDIFQTKLVAADRTIEEKKWQEAIDRAEEIQQNTDSEYWKSKAQKIIDLAEENKQKELEAVKSRQNQIPRQQYNKRQIIIRRRPRSQPPRYNRSNVQKPPNQKKAPKKTINICPGPLCNQ